MKEGVFQCFSLTMTNKRDAISEIIANAPSSARLPSLSQNKMINSTI